MFNNTNHQALVNSLIIVSKCIQTAFKTNKKKFKDRQRQSMKQRSIKKCVNELFFRKMCKQRLNTI